MDTGDFTRQTVELIAKRAGNMCSNPDCGALTCGPALAEDRSLTIGEAAHIFGSRPGSARFDPDITVSARAASTNAIWLCRNCHKLIDADPAQHSSELLFAWRRQHESAVAERIGKPGELIRLKLLTRQLAEFSNTSPLAQQIVIDKPDFWEQRLTAELLRYALKPTLSRWRALSRGMYARPSTEVVKLDHVADWNRARMNEFSNQITALAELINVEVVASWGLPGTPGDALEILSVASLFVEACGHLLAWEERVRFVTLPSEFDAYQAQLSGVAGGLLEQAAVLSRRLSDIFDQDEPSGEHEIRITFRLPDGWGNQISQTFKNALQEAYS